MGDIIIPEAALDEFLKLVLARVTKEGEGLVAESRARRNADEAMFRARLEVALERGLREINEIKRRMRAAEEEIERKRHAVDEELERKMRAAEEEIERKRRAAEDEIARLRQLERLHQTAAIEQSE